MKNILVIGSELCVAQELLLSNHESDDLYNFFESEVILEKGFKLHSEEHYEVCLFFSKVDHQVYEIFKKKIHSKCDKTIFIQDVNSLDFLKDRIVLATNGVYSNFGENELNSLYNKIERGEIVTVEETSTLNPISSTQLLKIIEHCIEIDIEPGVYHTGSNIPVSRQFLYMLFFRFSDITYNINYDDKIPTQQEFNNKRISEVSGHNFILLEKDILNTLRIRKRFPMIIGDLYIIDDVQYVIRAVNNSSKTVLLATIDDMETCFEFDFHELTTDKRA